MALTMKLETGLLRVVQNLNAGGWQRTKQAYQAIGPRKGADQKSLIEEMKKGPIRESMRTGFISGSVNPNRDPVSVLFVYPHTKSVDEVKRFAIPLRNIPGVEVMSTDEVQVYHILKHRWLVLEAGAVDVLSLQKGQPMFDEDSEEWEDEDQPSGIVTAESVAQTKGRRRIAHPKTYLVHRWRKETGSKSMRRVFGLRHARAMELEAKMTWKKMEKIGAEPTVDMVLMAIAGKNVQTRRMKRIVSP